MKLWRQYAIDSSTKILLYADDLKIFLKINSEHDRSKLQSDISSLQVWAKSNKMKFHLDKCKVLNCKISNKAQSVFKYFLYGTELKYTDNEKDLGVQVVPTLKWNIQHKKLLNKASQRIGLLRRNCSFNRNTQQRKVLYLAIVRSQFEHCSPIWRPVHKTNLEKFEAKQKRGIKWIFNEDFCSYKKKQYFDKLKQLDILPLAHKFNYNDLVLFHKLFYEPTDFSCTPEYLNRKHIPDPNSTRYTRSMTASDNLQLECSIKPRIDAFKNSYFYRTHILWNDLPLNIRSEYNLVSFKTKHKEYLWLKAASEFE